MGVEAGGKVPPDVLRKFVARLTGPFPAQSTLEEIKQYFTGWVEPGRWIGGRGGRGWVVD